MKLLTITLLISSIVTVLLIVNHYVAYTAISNDYLFISVIVTALCQVIFALHTRKRRLQKVKK